MIVKYGSHAHSNNECEIRIDRFSQFDDAGRRVKETERWTIIGFLQAASQAAITTAINSLKTAYSVDGRDLILYLDDGTTETSHSLKNSQAFGSTRVVKAPHFPEGRGAEYATFRSYQIEVEADFRVSGIGLLSFNESVRVLGTGGDLWVYKMALTGPPQRQTLAQQTTATIVQSGTAVGELGYPAFPGPLMPAHEHLERREITRQNPRRVGQVGNIDYTEWPVSWSYTFEVPGSASMQPNRWIGA